MKETESRATLAKKADDAYREFHAAVAAKDMDRVHAARIVLNQAETRYRIATMKVSAPAMGTLSER